MKTFFILVVLASSALASDHEKSLRARFTDSKTAGEFLRDYCKSPDQAVCAEFRKTHGREAASETLFEKERRAIDNLLVDALREEAKNGTTYPIDWSTDFPETIFASFDPDQTELSRNQKLRLFTKYLETFEKKFGWDKKALETIRGEVTNVVKEIKFTDEAKAFGVVMKENVASFMHQSVAKAEVVSPSELLSQVGLSKFRQLCGARATAVNAGYLSGRGILYVCPGALVLFGSLAGKKLELNIETVKALAFLVGHELFHTVDTDSLLGFFRVVYAKYVECLKTLFVPKTLTALQLKSASAEIVADFGGGRTLAKLLAKAKTETEKANLVKDNLEFLCNHDGDDEHPPSSARLEIMLADKVYSDAVGCSRDSSCDTTGPVLAK